MNSEFEKEAGNRESLLQMTPLAGAEGGTCNVYTARLGGRKVFVKEIKPEYAGDSRMLAAFRKENEIGFRLEHPNLVKSIYAEGILSADRYIVQEFIDGDNLRRFIKKNPDYFSKEENLEKFIREFADVLDYLHSNQVLHLDIKPENVLLTRIGHNLKLVDFGFCNHDSFDDTRGGTADYLAPERKGIQHKAATETDFYGLGKILEFIRKETNGKESKKFLRLEDGLLQNDPKRRISSKEEIETLLRPQKNLAAIWVVLSAVAVIAALVIIFNRPAEEILIQQPATRESGIATDSLVTISPLVSDSSSGDNLKIQGKIVEEIGVDGTDINVQETSKKELYKEVPKEIPQDPSVGSAPSTQIKNEPRVATPSIEKLQDEMLKNIRANFNGFTDRVDRYLKEERFSESDYKELSSVYNEAMRKSMNSGVYKKKYPDISDDLIDDLLIKIIEKEDRSVWYPAFMKYENRYQRLSRGSSR